MFIRITTLGEGNIDVSPEQANLLMKENMVFQCNGCGNLHLKGNVTRKAVLAKLLAGNN